MFTSLSARATVKAVCDLSDAAVRHVAQELPREKKGKGPQRVTICAEKNDHSVLTLGKAGATDRGVVGRTQTHIHFETKKSSGNTVVSLGAPPKHSKIDPGGAAYAMVTDGDAYHHAVKQHYVTSKAGDVVLRSKAGKAVMQSDGAVAEINSGKDVALTAGDSVVFWAGSYGTFAPAKNYQTAWKPQASQESAANALEPLMKMVEVVQSLADLATANAGLKKGQSMSPSTDTIKASKWGIRTSVAKLAVSFGTLGGLGKAITFAAKHSVSMGAGKAALLGGTMTASLTGALGSTLVAPVTGIKGFAFASVWASVEASLRAVKTAWVLSKNEVTIASRKETSVQADGGGVHIAAAGDAQLNGANAAVSGATCFVGAGSDFGIVGETSKSSFGSVKTLRNTVLAAKVKRLTCS